MPIHHFAAKTKFYSIKCSNPICWKEQGSSAFKLCDCKQVTYCSRDCQKSDWKCHRAWCTAKGSRQPGGVFQDCSPDTSSDSSRNPSLDSWPDPSMNAGREFSPSALPLDVFESKFKKWLKFHTTLLMAATIHALRLPEDLSRASSHILRVRLAVREDRLVAGDFKRYFSIDVAEVVDQHIAKKLGNEWCTRLEQLRDMRVRCEAAGRGTVAAVALECKPIGVQIIPLGSLENLEPIRVLNDWKFILTRGVTDGTLFTYFGY